MSDRTTATRLSRRGLLGGLAAGVGQAALGAPMTAMRPKPRAEDHFKQAVTGAERLVADAGVSGHTAFAVADAGSGMVLETGSPLQGHPPASSTKALTTIYALESLGEDYRFDTRLLATGPIREGKLEGDLVLAGGGDPTLDTQVLGDMADALKESGLREVTGALRVWDGALPRLREIDSAQPDHVAYNPGICGLNLNYNRVHFEWKRASGGYEVLMDARAGRFRPDVTTARMQVVDRRGPVYTYTDAEGVDDWTVAKGALGSDGARWLPVRRPGPYAGEVFRTLAEAAGIAFGRGLEMADGLPEGTEILRRQSEPIAPVLKEMLKYSTNLTAEVMGLTASQARAGQVDTLVHSAARMNAFLGAEFSAGSAAFEDHSGLGGDSRITPVDMVKALAKTGPESTLRHLMKDMSRDDMPGINVHAKTGTLNFVSALVGYAQPAGGSPLAFAIFSSDIPRRDALPMEQRERPEGNRAWLYRARKLQRDLLTRWSVVYGS